MTRISATEAARTFSDVLNRVAAGEEIEIDRNGAPIAVIGPARARFLSAERIRELLDGLPEIDDDFADDVRRLRAGVDPPEDPLALLIDTDLLIDWERKASSRDLDELIGDEAGTISVITVSELLHGARREPAPRRTSRRAFVEGLLGAFEPIPITEPVARVHAEVWAELADRGAVIGAHDLWIAASALTHGLGVATRNVAYFQRVPGLRVVAAQG